MDIENIPPSEEVMVEALRNAGVNILLVPMACVESDGIGGGVGELAHIKVAYDRMMSMRKRNAWLEMKG